MQDIDFQILREIMYSENLVLMTTSLRAFGEKLSRKLDLSVEEIDRRILQWNNAGVISKVTVFVDFRVLGMKLAVFDFRTNSVEEKHDFVKKAKAMDGVSSINVFFGNDIRVGFVSPTSDGLEEKLSMLKNLSGDSKPVMMVRTDLPNYAPAEDTLKLKALDCKVIKSLRPNARKPVGEIADEVGMPVEAVTQRLRRLYETHVIFPFVEMRLENLKGYLIASMVCLLDGSQRANIVMGSMSQKFENHFIRVIHPTAVAMHLYYRNLNDVSVDTTTAKQIAGVRTVKVDLFEKILINFDWIDGKLEQIIAKSVTT
ncbi:MAG: winged helix-turn-helix transcriptional regulator [Thaumarchaeota archaeon]|nr:winged helix-turn-helix transcriptional regulator [Nitrososphaerota archaeon]